MSLKFSLYTYCSIDLMVTLVVCDSLQNMLLPKLVTLCTNLCTAIDSINNSNKVTITVKHRKIALQAIKNKAESIAHHNNLSSTAVL